MSSKILWSTFLHHRKLDLLLIHSILGIERFRKIVSHCEVVLELSIDVLSSVKHRWSMVWRSLYDRESHRAWAPCVSFREKSTMSLKRLLPPPSTHPPNNRESHDCARTNICYVCGDKAHIANYGILSCPSCKTFFRRHGFQLKVGWLCSYSFLNTLLVFPILF